MNFMAFWSITVGLHDSVTENFLTPMANIQGSSFKTKRSTWRFASPETLLDPLNTSCLYARAWACGVHSAVLYWPPAWTGNWLQQCIFVCKCYFKWESLGRVRTEYIQKFPGEVPPSRFTVPKMVKEFETTGSVANKKRNRERIVLTEETLDEIGTSLERTPTKFIPKLAQQLGISESSAHRTTKLLKLKPYRYAGVHSLKQDDPVSWMHYC